jgi:hypothetical protein
MHSVQLQSPVPRMHNNKPTRKLISMPLIATTRLPTTITYAYKVMHALANFHKAIQGITGKARTSQATQDLQRILDATQAHLQAHPNKFEETITLDNTRNMQKVLRVQAPPSIPKPNINDNRQITRSMQLQTLVPRVHSNKSTGKLICVPLVTTTRPSTTRAAWIH